MDRGSMQQDYQPDYQVVPDDVNDRLFPDDTNHSLVPDDTNDRQQLLQPDKPHIHCDDDTTITQFAQPEVYARRYYIIVLFSMIIVEQGNLPDIKESRTDISPLLKQLIDIKQMPFW